MNINLPGTKASYIFIPFIILLAGGLYLLSLHNYLLYHTLIEFAGIIVAFTIFVIGWNTRKFSGNNMIIILAAGYLAVGAIDMLHTITFTGMGIFPGINSNPATQFWISARYLEAAAFLLAASYLARPVKVQPNKLMFSFIAAGMLLTYAVFAGYFPDCYLEGQGLTTFKIASEYVISAMFIAAGIIFWNKRAHLEKNILSMLLFAGAFTVMSEMSFTLYEDVYGFFNYLGHILKLFSIVLIFNALVYQSLTNPFQSLFREISETNEKISHNEKKFRDLIEQSSDWILETDLNGNIVYSNPKAKELTGYDLNALLGSSLFGFMDPAEAGKQIEHLFNIAARQEPFYRLEVTILHKDGHTLIFEANGRPVYNEQGQLIGYRGIAREITGRKRTEHELMEAKEKAEQANLAKNRFLAKMSHEIRNPLNVIMGSNEILSSTDLSASQKEWTEMIKVSAEALLDMINDVLDYSRVEAGKLHLNHYQFNLYGEIESIVSSFNDQASEKGLQLSYNVEGNLPRTVVGDPERLRQVVSKLVENAIKFTRKGVVAVTLKPLETNTYQAETNRHPGYNGVIPVQFSVRDEGTGMSPEQVDTLLQSTYQVDDQKSSGEYKGPGLGLALSKKLIEMMGGSIDIKSTLNRGSAFYFTIPFVLPEYAVDINEESRAEITTPKEEPGREIRKLEILLVEDKPLNQKLAAYILEKNGHSVTAANNGIEALELYRKRRYDLIFMDIHMPEMDGLEATVQIRAAEQEENRRTPIIAMTAYDMPEDQSIFLQAGMDYCVTKPVNSDDLYYALEAVRDMTPEKPEEQDIPRDDIREMLQRVEGNTELLEELLEMFFLDFHKDLATMKESLKNRDAKNLAITAHGLKGELGNLGMKSAFNTVRELEKQAKENNLEEVLPLLDLLEQKVKGLEKFFSQADWQDKI